MAINRRESVAVDVSGVKVGGGHPVVVQSMTNTDTVDAEGTARQIADLARAGSELAEARSLNAAYSCIARNRATFTCVPKICALREATVYTGLRRAGMPEE